MSNTIDTLKTIVVTGGAGFIGSGLISFLNGQGYSKIIIIDNLGTDDKWKNLVGKKFLNIIPIDQCFEWLEGSQATISTIFHLGACSSTVEKDADFLLRNNFHFSIKLAEYALKYNKRFIYASSAATYGDGSKGFSDDHDLLEALEPLNMYGYSKHLFDLWVKQNNCLDKFVGLKYFNVFGPNESHKGRMASAITHVLPQAQKNGVIRLFKSSEPDLYADGDQCRDFIYVKDAVRMTYSFMNNDACGIYNIGTGKAGTWNVLAQSVFKAINKPVKIDYIQMPDDLSGKYQNYTRAEMKKTAGVLGQDAFCESLEDGIIDYIQNYLLQDKRW